MPPRHHLRALGEPSLVTAAGQPVALRTRKALALLVYLAVERRPHTREALAALLWPRASRTDGRHSVANALSEIRGRLGRDALDTTPERVALRPGAVTLDVDRLLADDIFASAAGPQLDVDGFLDGVELPDAVPFAHWIEAQQARLLPHIVRALERLADRARRTGDFRRIETLGERLQRFDPLSEEGVRARMEARAHAGDRITALRIFEHWRTELTAQLGASPSAFLDGMAMRLRRRGWERPEDSDIPTVRTEHWQGEVFVGRGPQYENLYTCWERAQRREPVHRLLLGDHGIGKTTLAQRLLTAVALEGATAVRHQCNEVEHEIPYAAITHLISQLVYRPGAGAADPEELAELGQTIPAVRARFPNLPSVPEQRGESARIRFSEATHALLSALADEHPVVLVLDDVHYCDDVSLAVLHYVIRRATEQPIMAVFIARHDRLASSPQAARLRDAGHLLNIHHLELPPLSDDESAELLDAHLPDVAGRPSATVRRALVRAASGFPHVLELIARDWSRHGEASLALSLDAMTRAVRPEGAPEAAYRLLFQRLLQSFDQPTRNTLTLASILGPRLNDPTMYALADLSMGQTMDGLVQLRTARLLRDSGDGLEFANELLRAEAYLATPGMLRTMLHGRVADRLIADHANGDDEVGLEIAWHCIRSGRQEEAIPYLLSGARKAIGRGAVHEAERRLGTAMGWLTGEALREASVLLCELFQEQSRWEESLTALAHHPEAPGSDAGWVLISTAQINSTHRTSSDLARVAAELGRLLASTADERALALGCRLAGQLCAQTRDEELSRQYASTIAQIAERRFDTYDQAFIRVALIKARYYALPSFDASDELNSLAQQVRAHSTANALSVSILNGLAITHARYGRYQEALDSSLAAFQVAKRLDNASLMLAVLGNTALYLGRLGEYRRQREYAEKAVKHPYEGNPGFPFLMASYQLALSLVFTGDAARADEIMVNATDRAGSGIADWAANAWHLYMADIELLRGRRARADRLAKSAIEELGDNTPKDSFAGLYSRWLARLRGRHLEAEKTDEMLRRILERIEFLDVADRAEVSLAIDDIVAADGGSGVNLVHEQKKNLRHAVNHMPEASVDLMNLLLAGRR